MLLHQAGLAESDVTIVVTGLLNFAPLLQGQVDATAATDTGLLVGRRKGLGEVNVIEVSNYLNVSSDLFVVREAVYQQKKPLLKRFLAAYRDSAAWMIAKPDEAAHARGQARHRRHATRRVNLRDDQAAQRRQRLAGDASSDGLGALRSRRRCSRAPTPTASSA